MNNKIIALSVVILIVVIASGIVFLQLMNQGTVNTQVSEEMLQINNSGVWYGYGFTYAQAAVLIYNTKNTPAILQEITIMGIKSEWGDTYYWKGEIGSVSSLSPASNELNGSTVRIAVDGTERTFQQASEKIELEPYKAIVLYIKNAGNITSQNMPDGNVTIAVFTERNVYLAEATLKQDWPIPFMDTEQMQITQCQFTDSGATITLSVRNTGTSAVVINSATVNSADAPVTGTPVTVAKNSTGTIILTANWVAGNVYQIRLLSAKGNYFQYNAVAP